jgi:phage terminase large subunit-like protein
LGGSATTEKTRRSTRNTRAPSREPFAAFCEQIGLRLEPFQKRIAKAAAGPEPEFLALLPRGQGKTTLLAALALYHLLAVENAAVYCAASSREQARILFEAAAEFARRLEHPNVVVRHLELRFCDDPERPNVFSRHLRVLAADAPRLHGLTPSLSIVDELHAHVDDEVYLALRTATLKRPESKLLIISTAGMGADSPLGRLRARALGQPHVTRRGALTDARGPHLRMLEWSVPEDVDVSDMRQVKKANPASWISAAALGQQYEAIPRHAFERYHANRWVAQVGAWLPPGAWQACAGETSFEPGERIWIACDLGGERSDSAVVWLNERLQVGVMTWSGDSAVLDVKEFVEELATNFTAVEIAVDPWRAAGLAGEWQQRGLTVVTFPQSDSRMIQASERLYDVIVHKQLVHPDDPELNAHVHAAVAKHTRRGWRLDRPSRGEKIDACIALAMAVDVHAQQPQPVQVVGWL